jgi:hypothetical protein
MMMTSEEKAIARAIRCARRAPGYHVVYCNGSSMFVQAGELPRPPRSTIIALVCADRGRVEITFGEPSDGERQWFAKTSREIDEWIDSHEVYRGARRT